MHGEPTPILFIEDDPADATLLRLALERSAGDYAITRASRLSRGIEMARSDAYQIILTDLGLPDAIGLEAVEHLCVASPHAAIIVVSGEDNEQLYFDALSHGADSFLCKTDINAVMVHRCIRQSLHRVKQSEEIRHLIQASTEQRQRLEAQSLLLASKNQRLEQLCATSQEFVNNVSHEFRTPLCVAKQYASLIADEAVGPVNDEQRMMLNVIEGRMDDLNTIVDDMLDISRHESGLLAASRVVCSATEIVERILPGLQQRASLRDIELLSEIPDDVQEIYCDPEKISRVLINLIVNALKFTSEKDTVVVRVSQCLVSQEVTFAVCDSGPGIDPEQRDSIFARFQQGDTNLRSSTKGFGLGLSIAKDLVDLNLGEMSLQSVVGKGSTFSFTVPMNEPTEVGNRYLRRLQRHSEGKLSAACVIRAKVDSAATPQSNQEVHVFLNYLLKSNDLILPVQQNQWLLILNTHREEIQSFFDRVHNETELLNRNRPQGPLPSVALELVGELDHDHAETALHAMIQESGTEHFEGADNVH